MTNEQFINGSEFLTDAKGRLVPKAQIKPEHLMEDDFVKNVLQKVSKHQDEMIALKTGIIDDLFAFIDLVNEKFGYRRGGKKGNVSLTSYDGCKKIVYSISDTIDFGVELQAAKGLIEEYLDDVFKHVSESEEINELRSLVNFAFQVDKNGKVNRDAILRLRKRSISHPKWTEAVKAINDTAFTIEASRVTFRTGYTANVTPSTNFITVNKNKASVQTAFNVPISGPNGMGGVTVEGTVTNYRVTTDKKSGDTMVSMSIMGVGISATANIRLFKDCNKA